MLSLSLVLKQKGKERVERQRGSSGASTTEQFWMWRRSAALRTSDKPQGPQKSVTLSQEDLCGCETHVINTLTHTHVISSWWKRVEIWNMVQGFCPCYGAKASAHSKGLKDHMGLSEFPLSLTATCVRTHVECCFTFDLHHIFYADINTTICHIKSKGSVQLDKVHYIHLFSCKCSIRKEKIRKM